MAGEIGFGGNGIGFVAGGVGGEEFAEARDAPKAASLAGVGCERGGADRETEQGSEEAREHGGESRPGASATARLDLRELNPLCTEFGAAHDGLDEGHTLDAVVNRGEVEISG